MDKNTNKCINYPLAFHSFISLFFILCKDPLDVGTRNVIAGRQGAGYIQQTLLTQAVIAETVDKNTSKTRKQLYSYYRSHFYSYVKSVKVQVQTIHECLSLFSLCSRVLVVHAYYLSGFCVCFIETANQHNWSDTVNANVSYLTSYSLLFEGLVGN